MTLLDKKISLCENFLKDFAKYRCIQPLDFSEEGDVPVIVYRLKIALILQFLESMGIKKEIGYVNTLDFSNEEGGDRDFFYPDAENFELWMKGCSPYFHFSDMPNVRSELWDMIYADGECYEDSGDEDGGDEISGLIESVRCDLSDFPLNEKTPEEIAVFINEWFRSEEYDLFHYAQLDELYPLYFKRCKERVTVDGKPVIKSIFSNADTQSIDKLYETSLPVNSQYSIYDVDNEEDGKLFIFTFGADNSGYEPYNATQTNFVYAIEQALMHLYIFRLDQELHFLPKEYKGGERKIFPKVRLN